jgi:hypothetical protein
VKQSRLRYLTYWAKQAGRFRVEVKRLRKVHKAAQAYHDARSDFITGQIPKAEAQTKMEWEWGRLEHALYACNLGDRLARTRKRNS